MRRARLWVLLLLLSGCGRIGFETLAAGSDAGMDAGRPPRDAGMDAAVADAGRDAGMDAGRDTGTDTGLPDTGMPDTGTPDTGVPDTGGPDEDAGMEPEPCAELPVPLDPCLEIPYLGGPPLMDGVLDGMVECGPPLATIPQIGWTNATQPIPIEHRARYTLGYREDGIYVYISIRDADRLPAIPTDPPWRGDGVEIYLDSDGLFPLAPDYDAPGAFQFCIAAPADDVTPISRATMYRNAVDHGPWTSSRFATFPVEGGYVFEGWFAAADLGLATWELIQTGHIGFNISINVSAPTDDQGVVPTQGTRVGQYFLHTGGANCMFPYCASDAFCTPELK